MSAPANTSADSCVPCGLIAQAVLANLDVEQAKRLATGSLAGPASNTRSTVIVEGMWGHMDVAEWLEVARLVPVQRHTRGIAARLWAAQFAMPGDQGWFSVGGSLDIGLVRPTLGEVGIGSREEDALLAIARVAQAEPSVKSVYVQKLRSDVQVFMVLMQSKYDLALMDRLLDHEWDVRQAFAELFFDFVYPTGTSQGAPDFIHPRARCIFSR